MAEWRNYDRRGSFRGGARGGRGGGGSYGRGFQNNDRGGSFQGRNDRPGNTVNRTPEVKKDVDLRPAAAKPATPKVEPRKEVVTPKTPVVDSKANNSQPSNNSHSSNNSQPSNNSSQTSHNSQPSKGSNRPNTTPQLKSEAVTPKPTSDSVSRGDRSDETRKREFKDVEKITGETHPEDSEELKKKYSNASKCRLFIGNLPSSMTEQDFRSMFIKYGEIVECFHNQYKGFGFIRLDTKYNAERAKDHIDGIPKGGRVLRCRYASQGSAIKLKNLPMHVSNEYLEENFQQFGQIERCVVICDERGKSTGDAIIEFGRKPSANSALTRINEGVFLVGVNPQPVGADPLETKDEDDGLPEKFVVQTPDVAQDREAGARFAVPGSFEYEWGMRWKQLEAMEKQQHDNLKKQMNEARDKLKFEMEDAYHDYQTNLMRQDLIRRQEELSKLENQRAQEAQRRRAQFEARFGSSGAGRMMDDMQGGDAGFGMQPLNPPPIPAAAGRQDMPDMGMGGQAPGNMPQARPSRFDQVPAGFQFQQPGGGGQQGPHGGQQGHHGGQFDNFGEGEQQPRPLMNNEQDFFEHKRPRMF